MGAASPNKESLATFSAVFSTMTTRSGRLLAKLRPGGKVDHIPATIFAGYPKLMRVHDAVRDHLGVKSWYAKA
jgi:hypothetical protein